MLFLAQAGGVTVDVIFCVLLGVGLIIGTMVGFVKGICKIAGTVFSVVGAVAFCVPLHNSLTAITNAMAGALGYAIAEVLCIVISFIILLVGIKLLAWLLGKLLTALIEKFKPFAVVNRCLGGLLGLFEAFLLAFVILALCRLINADGIMQFLASSKVVGGIYRTGWFQWAASLQFLR